MDATSLPTLAGSISTLIFATSTLPMLVKARRTRDLGSYSLGNMLLANTGNAVHTIYVLSLPPGPIWVLHGFYVVSTLLMLVWFLRYTDLPIRRHPKMRVPADALRRAALLTSSSPTTEGGRP